MTRVTAGLLAAGLVAHVAAQKVIQFDIEKKSIPHSDLAKRATIKSYLFNDINNGLYSVNVSIGTPGQNFQLQLDTGSTDVWVNSASSSFCQTQGNCADSFDNTKSSTYQVAEANEFNVTYGDGSGAAGDLFTDVLDVGGVLITNQTMGLASTSDIAYGLMGVGMVGTEGSCSTEEGPTFCYPNVLDSMVSQGKINSHAFSLYLNDIDQSTGSILFGGVDSARYTGDLVSVPMVGIPLVNGSTETDRYTVAWTNFTITTSNGVETFFQDAFSQTSVPALLDSGTTLSLLPTTVYKTILEQMGAVELEGGAFAPCYLRVANATIDFHVGGTDGYIFSIPLRELLFDVDSSLESLWHDLGGSDYCQVGLQSGDDIVIFGDVVLRSAYIVYDLDNRQIALANANFNPGNNQDIKEITNGTTSNIPGVSRTASAASSLSTVSSATAAVHSSLRTGATSVGSVTTASNVPLASFTTASYTGQGDFVAGTGITTSAPSGTGSGSSSSSSGAASAVSVPHFSIELPAILSMVSVFVAVGAGMIML